MSDSYQFHVRELFPYALGLCVLVVSLTARFFSYPVVTSDYTYFVKVWFDALLSHPGLSAFAQPFSDYAPLYLYLLKLLTFIPASSLYLAKSLSLVFDIAIAALVVLFARATTSLDYSRGALFLIFAIFLSIPTVVMNSSLWGQSDALYAAPIVLCLYFMLKDRPLAAAIAYGFAFSIKVQAIFFLPVLAGYLLAKPETRWYILIPFIVFAATLIPAIAQGGDPSYWPLVYLKQSGEYPYLSDSAPSIFAFVNNLPLSSGMSDALFWAGITLAALWGIIVAYLSSKVAGKIGSALRPRVASMIVLLSLASVLIIPYLLPRMHERYFYLADIISCLYVLYEPRRWYLAVLIVSASALSYMPYLSSQVAALSFVHVDLRIPAAILFVAVCAVLAMIFASSVFQKDYLQ